ncbi:uncharacterized protein MONBRDRAFT_38339 [Monosiga brevicollis MX1]|uniref:GH18 domain-containing protein n=1 Tax=Monosiga brevicollis TaxID=81824 RepID=A9V738_MONBE|nr:uncharacterized protein MONBRDRAFT_38339 [Monosiga brevicollis MX1]EDQ86724.1 predicted protein [Monosiga brevicollis MX1]|eukprot:XP_001748560.1 hypothetical protein [Monosiga brevicollis MX1]
MKSAAGALLAALALLAAVSAVEAKFAFGNYFANWAQYRAGDFSYTPQQLAPAVSKFDYIVYAFAWMNGGCGGCNGDVVYDRLGQCRFPNGTCSMFSNGTRESPECPTGAVRCTEGNFTLVSPEPADPQFYESVVAFKQQNPGLKVLLSVGGWNFPSSVYSIMVSDDNYRLSFINSCLDFMTKYGFDGIDLDWEFWGSGPRDDEIKLSNSSFHPIYDVGGQMPGDAQGLLSLVTEMRSYFGPDRMITVATQADMGKMSQIDIPAVSEQIDYWHLMAYGTPCVHSPRRRVSWRRRLPKATTTGPHLAADAIFFSSFGMCIDYSVSDLPEMCGDSPCFANFTAPNQPLFAVKEGQIPAHEPAFPSSYWSVNYTITGYLKAGAPPEKLVLGLTFYGHLWYTPGQENNWQRFGVPAALSHGCYGPFNPTFGAWPGRRAELCGLLIYSEIVSLIDPANETENFFDPTTQSDIGFIRSGDRAGEDLGNTTPGWVSWNSIKSLQAITTFAMEAGIGGVFAFDASMDVFENGYPVVTAIHDTITGGNNNSSNVCNPSAGCNVCKACCQSYLKNQDDCDACVKAECKTNQCTGTCNVCDSCCKPYLKDQTDCDSCVQSQCSAIPF